LIVLGCWLGCEPPERRRDALETTPLATTAAPRHDERPRCRDGMVHVGGGSVRVGSKPGEGEADELPERRVTLAPYCLARRETTVTDYQRCVASAKCTAPGTARAENCNAGYPDRRLHPINCIDWTQALGYCRSIGGRLPREYEWEHAARGNDARRYPWGNAPPDASRLNACGAECAAVHRGATAMFGDSDGFAKTAPVGSFPRGRSPFGIDDMAGNVWEWTSDEFGGQPPARVVRGGGWFHYKPERVRAANRHGYPPSEQNGHLGVRCAADPRAG
jgi:formylglycine-generating enzyme required for sulfatase activity